MTTNKIIAQSQLPRVISRSNRSCQITGENLAHSSGSNTASSKHNHVKTASQYLHFTFFMTGLKHVEGSLSG